MRSMQEMWNVRTSDQRSLPIQLERDRRCGSFRRALLGQIKLIVEAPLVAHLYEDKHLTLAGFTRVDRGDPPIIE